MLKVKELDQSDFALAFILQDEILFPEFLRSTKDGDMQYKAFWEPFKYRWYQKDLLTDKNHYIILTGGRSIGKCMLSSDRLLTDKGYITHGEAKKSPFKAYSIDKEGNLELEIGYCTENGLKSVYRLSTAYDTIHCTDLHPVFTQNGYTFARDIQIGDLVQTLTKLPHVQNTDHNWQELRLLGYLFYDIHRYKLNKTPLKVRSSKAREELRAICEYFNLKYLVTNEGIILRNRKIYTTHPLSMIFKYFNLHYVRQHTAWDSKQNRISKQIMTLNEKDLQIFLEAFFSQYAILEAKKIKIPIPNYRMEGQLRELLLRFGIMTKAVDGELTRREITKDKHKIQKFNYFIETLEDQDAFRFWKTFNIPGYKFDTVPRVEDREQWIFTPIIHKEKLEHRRTYAVQVRKNHTYVAEGIHVHNSLVLEDKILFDLFNSQKSLGKTPELVLATANQAQMTPLLTHLNGRILQSPFLRNFTKTGVNKNEGILEINQGIVSKMFARIAGSKGANNMIGLHTPRIIIDEGQVFPNVSFTELMPVLNFWEKEHQIMIAGVPNNISNSILYRIDKRNKKYKKYRVPATNNPYYTYQKYREDLSEYGGDTDDRFQTLILGRHGSGSEQVLVRDQIGIEAYPFHTYSYSYIDKNKNIEFQEKLSRHNYSCDMYMAGIDTGFVDPTIISIFGLKNNKWYHLCRYKLQRIQYPEQEKIIHWLHEHFQFTKIGIDIGSGGSGATIIQSFIIRKEYQGYRYDKVLQGIQFSENQLVGYNEKGEEVYQDTKSVGADELVKQIQSQNIIYNSIDNEGINQLERIAKQKGLSGKDRYFVASEKGAGSDKNDHIFSSYICFAILIRDLSFLQSRKRKLGKTIR